MRILAFALLLVPGPIHADENLWALLKAGGQVILVRHTITDPGSGDPPGMRLDDCSTQRNLSDEGRAHARRIGEVLRKREIPMGRVLSSPWCRCVETAKLAFGREPEVSTALSNLFGRQERRDSQVKEMRKLVAREKANRVLVSHGSTISALTGEYLGTGEMLIVTPEAEGKFAVRGKILLD